jgi:hypothetical protein
VNVSLFDSRVPYLSCFELFQLFQSHSSIFGISDSEDVLCGEFVPAVSEEVAQGLIDEDKTSSCGGQCHPVRSIIEYGAKAILALLYILQCTLAIRHVRNGSEYPFVILKMNVVQIHFYRNFGPTFMQASQFLATARNLTIKECGVVAVPLRLMGPKTSWQENFDRLMRQFASLVSEQRLAMPIGQDDLSIVADHHHRIKR